MQAVTSSTDPFSASIIPFEVPEQMRALAEQASEMSQIVGKAAMEAAKPKT